MEAISKCTIEIPLCSSVAIDKRARVIDRNKGQPFFTAPFGPFLLAVPLPDSSVKATSIATRECVAL